MRIFKNSKPLMFECPLCGRIYKQGEWILITAEERCEMEKRKSTFSYEIECKQLECVSGYGGNL